jgi:hypothetical protein
VEDLEESGLVERGPARRPPASRPNPPYAQVSWPPGFMASHALPLSRDGESAHRASADDSSAALVNLRSLLVAVRWGFCSTARCSTFRGESLPTAGSASACSAATDERSSRRRGPRARYCDGSCRNPLCHSAASLGAAKRTSPRLHGRRVGSLAAVGGRSRDPRGWRPPGHAAGRSRPSAGRSSEPRSPPCHPVWEAPPAVGTAPNTSGGRPDRGTEPAN